MLTRRDPVIVSLHHEVLPVWAELRRECAAPPPVLSLDFHTDTLSAMRRGVPAPAADAWRDPAAVETAVRTLHHDEHFDWALRSGVISRAVILAISPQNGPCGHSGMTVSPFAGNPGLQPLLNNAGGARHFADGILTDGLPAAANEFFVMREPWILDVDCDVFLTAAAADFPETGRFAELVKRASLITISQEPDWVRLLQLPGESVTGAFLAKLLGEKCRLIRKKFEFADF